MANEARMVPAVKILRAVKTKERLENFSIKKAVIGMRIPFVSIKAVVSHWPLLTSILNSSMICGIAGIRSVWFKIATNAPTRKIPTITDRLYDVVDWFMLSLLYL